MPFTAPLMFGTSQQQYDAIIQFAGATSTGTTEFFLYNSNVTVISDPNNILGTPVDGNPAYVPFNTFGTFTFTLIEPATFTSKETSASVNFGRADINGAGNVNVFYNYFTLYTDTQQNPSPVDKTVTDDINIEGLAIQFPPFEAYNFDGGVQIGIKQN